MADRIRLSLDRLGMKPSPFAMEHKLPQMTRYLQGSVPSFDSLQRLAGALGVTWQWLLIGDEGLKAMNAISQHEPIIIEDGQRYAIATYVRTEDGVPLYRVRRKHRGFRELRLAVTAAKTIREDEKL